MVLTRWNLATDRGLGVRPDFAIYGHLLTRDNNDNPVIEDFTFSTLIEVKATSSINLTGSRDKQILSMIVAAANSRSVQNPQNTASNKGVAMLVLVTPSDTVISQEVIDAAKFYQVNLQHITAFIDKNDPNKIGFSLPKELNRATTNPLPYWMHAVDGLFRFLAPNVVMQSKLRW